MKVKSFAAKIEHLIPTPPNTFLHLFSADDETTDFIICILFHLFIVLKIKVIQEIKFGVSLSK